MGHEGAPVRPTRVVDERVLLDAVYRLQSRGVVQVGLRREPACGVFPDREHVFCVVEEVEQEDTVAGVRHIADAANVLGNDLDHVPRVSTHQVDQLHPWRLTAQCGCCVRGGRTDEHDHVEAPLGWLTGSVGLARERRIYRGTKNAASNTAASMIVGSLSSLPVRSRS